MLTRILTFSNENIRLKHLACQSDMWKELGEKKRTNMRCLVVDGGRVLEMVRQVFDRFLLGEHADIRTLLERGHECIRVVHIEQIADLFVRLNPEAAEEDHQGISSRKRGMQTERVTQTVELAGHTDLELLGWQGKALVK